ncbi:large proline-rich protein BAG6 isoform X2 [Ischnura elegans]|uniref:large proline-rich protein BAG6 isoform X2 n=1 Tax=Ischnura elegans TaxID=197161 RepID=UPI001ED88A45|nr:large proline-rich protein BAG6 isoform X2 [Ischnura elegans]
MIELTVKTLDSQNHKFSVPDDVTVKQFKEKIAESINVPADSQRLIYCGKLLQDDKNLSEYDVNGKVVHLVQRAPPQATPNNNTSNARRTQPHNTNHRRIHYHHHHYHRQPRFDGNTMYFGAMAIPADIIDDQSIGIRATLPQGFSRTRTRIVLAQQMLNRAQDVLNRLENPDAPLPDIDNANEDLDLSSSSSGGESSSSSGAGAGGNTNGNTSGGHTANGQANSISGSIMQAAHAATAAAIAAAVSAVQAAGLPNITIMRGPPQAGGESGEGGSSDDTGRGGGIDDQARGSEGPQSSTASAPADESNMGEESNRRTIEAPRTTALADVLQTLVQTETRLQPFLQQYLHLMQNDPAADSNGDTAESMQRTYNSVSEVMHYLSHAYHAMSDIICDFSQAPPRNLRSRPLVIQHSAVLQAGIPIQAQINVMGNRSASSTGSQQQSPSENSTPTASTAPNAASQSNDSSSFSEPMQQSGTPLRPQSRLSRSQAPSGLPPVVSITPGNVEFIMELGQAGATIDSIQATVVTNGNSQASGNDGNSNASGNTQQQSFTWPRPPPAELLENMLQAMAGQMMMGRGSGNTATVTINGNPGGGATARNRSSSSSAGATASSTSANSSTTAASTSGNTTTSGGGNGGGGGGQNSQARGNTATHPTTSTQTRSTSRPHVQLAPAALQGLGANSFDPFLPCSSHHLSSPRRRPRPQQAASSSTTEPQVQASAPTATESTPSETPNQQNMSRLDLLIAFMNHWLGNGTGGRSSNASTAEGETSASSASATPSTRHGRTFIATDFSDDGLLDQLNVPLELSWLGLLNQLRQGSSQNEAGQNRTPEYSLEMFGHLIEGATSMLYQGSPTVADFLQTVPDYSYSEGESFLTDLIMLVARNMTFENMIALSVGHSRVLDQMQPQLNEFVLQRVLLGQLPTQERISEAVDRILLEIQPPADILEAVHIREDVDLMASINRFCQVRLTELIRLILTKSNPGNFGQSLMTLCGVIVMELTSLLMNCCDGGEPEVEAMLQVAVRHLTSGVHPELQRWTINSSLTRFRNYVARMNARHINVDEFIVRQSRNAESSSKSEKPSSSSKEGVRPEPMETDNVARAPMETPVVENGVVSVGDGQDLAQSVEEEMELEDIPGVILQPENWPTSLPSEWVPIIARDSVRQRRQGSQPPFSDVYLTGMPSKRRKVVTNSKRRGNVSQIISERVQRAVEAAGVGSSILRDGSGTITGPEQLGQAAAGDLTLQRAYREQVLMSLRQRVRSDPDFTPERYPNAANYLSK